MNDGSLPKGHVGFCKREGKKREMLPSPFFRPLSQSCKERAKALKFITLEANWFSCYPLESPCGRIPLPPCPSPGAGSSEAVRQARSQCCGLMLPPAAHLPWVCFPTGQLGIPSPAARFLRLSRQFLSPLRLATRAGS